MKWLKSYSDHAYALMRIVAGYMFGLHGVQKILGILTDSQPELWSQIWFGGVIELVGGFMVMIGLRSRWAALICSGEMAVAYMQFHWKFQFGEKFFPVVNHGEMALLYCFVFLYIATRGTVKWGVDRT